LRLYYYSALEGHSLANDFYDQFVRKFIALVKELVKRGVKDKIFRKVDPEEAALAFTGMLRSYCITRALFPDHAIREDSASVTVGFCNLFLQGIVPR